MNQYYIKARLFPTVLTSIPVLYFYNTIVSEIYRDDLKKLFQELPIVTDILISTSLIFLLVQVNRLISKEIFQRFYFKDELEMPTTNFLLKSNSEMEINLKLKIQSKIKQFFDLELLNHEEEIADELAARKLIVTAVSQIRNSLRDNQLLFQHNIEYGFFRNLIGGSFLSVLISTIVLIVFYLNKVQTNDVIIYFFISLYILPIFFSSYIIRRLGKYYARVLFEQFIYMSDSKK
jgi:hypothetical protein